MHQRRNILFATNQESEIRLNGERLKNSFKGYLIEQVEVDLDVQATRAKIMMLSLLVIIRE